MGNEKQADVPWSRLLNGHIFTRPVVLFQTLAATSLAKCSTPMK